MPSAQKICRVCGKRYEACRTAPSVKVAFRWQDVSCSPECGAEYLRRVNAARGVAQEDHEKVAPAVVAEQPISDESQKASRRTRKKVKVDDVATETEE